MPIEATSSLATNRLKVSTNPNSLLVAGPGAALRVTEPRWRREAYRIYRAQLALLSGLRNRVQRQAKRACEPVVPELLDNDLVLSDLLPIAVSSLPGHAHRRPETGGRLRPTRRKGECRSTTLAQETRSQTPRQHSTIP